MEYSHLNQRFSRCRNQATFEDDDCGGCCGIIGTGFKALVYVVVAAAQAGMII